MSSGFVSGGTVDNPVERDDEWRQAQAEIEAARKAKADLAAQHNGKSLFEILQENKDKKQAEFEEKARYKLHVSLDDDEADYLRELEEKKRKEEASVRKDTHEQLDAFRRQQEEAERRALEEESAELPKGEEALWAATRKRKKDPETSLLKGIKLKKSNSTSDDKSNPGNTQSKDDAPSIKEGTATDATKKDHVPTPAKSTTPATKPIAPVSLSLGYASSDEED